MNYPQSPNQKVNLQSRTEKRRKSITTLTCISLPQHTDILQRTLEYNIQQHALLFSLSRF